MRVLCLVAIATLTVARAAHAGEDPNRLVLLDGALAISRPDEYWTLEFDESDPQTVVMIRSPDDKAEADVQVQRVPGASLDQLKQPIEQAVADKGEGFRKLSGRDIEIGGVAAYELGVAVTVEGEPYVATLLILKPRDTLYIVKCKAPAEDWERFEAQCDGLLGSFEVLDELRRRFVPTESYEERSIEGWIVRVNKELLSGGDEVGDEALKLLEAKLFEVRRAVPEEAWDKLRQVPIWLGVDDGHAPIAEYHPSRDWLEAHGYNPDKAQSVEIGNASLFLHASRDQPALVVHELAHAYLDRVLGYDHEGIRAAYRAAVDGGQYEKVLRIQGQEERAYALENEQEYFAEATEAFFGTNDFYPFVRAELQRHDPKLFKLLAEVWGVTLPD
jgi:hypothetical protein